MANVHGKNCSFTFEDTSGSVIDITGDGNNFSLNETSPTTEDTGFGDTSVQRVPRTIPDAKLQYEAYANDDATTGNIRKLGDMKGRQTVVNFVGVHAYSACMLINDVEIRNPVANLVTCRALFELWSGSITRSNLLIQYLLTEDGKYIVSESSLPMVTEATNARYNNF